MLNSILRYPKPLLLAAGPNCSRNPGMRKKKSREGNLGQQGRNGSLWPLIVGRNSEARPWHATAARMIIPACITSTFAARKAERLQGQRAEYLCATEPGEVAWTRPSWDLNRFRSAVGPGCSSTFRPQTHDLSRTPVQADTLERTHLLCKSVRMLLRA